MSLAAVDAAFVVYANLRDTYEALPNDVSVHQWAAAFGKMNGAFEAYCAASLAESEECHKARTGEVAQ